MAQTGCQVGFRVSDRTVGAKCQDDLWVNPVDSLAIRCHRLERDLRQVSGVRRVSPKPRGLSQPIGLSTNCELQEMENQT